MRIRGTPIVEQDQAVKVMVEARYQEMKEKAKASVEKATAVSLTSDMWTSINTEAYLAVTCHFVDESSTLNTVVLGVQYFPNAHTAENIAQVKGSLMAEWAITDKVTCLVTDGAANMGACARELRLKHAICIAHTLNLVVKKALDQTPELSDIRAKSRKIVGYFRSSTTAKERLSVVQEQLRKPQLKLIQEVETRWNNTYNMLQRLFEQREPVGAALASLTTDIPPMSSEEFGIISECLVVLAPFNDATTELSQEKRVSGSKVIPLLTMLDHCLNEQMEKSPSIGSSLAQKLRMLLREKLDKIQTMSIMFLATLLLCCYYVVIILYYIIIILLLCCYYVMSIMFLVTLLDPRFRKLGFLSPVRASEAEKILKAECASVMRASTTSSSSAPPPQPSTSQSVEAVSHGNNLWRRLDESVRQTQTQNVTADANIEDPLKYWERQKYVYPHLYKLALTYLCTPASSVPLFSKAGEILSKKRNRLRPATVEKLLFLNKNQ
ncbi:carboxypeptidase N regulatory subunit [Sarotherodon galilaeus]